MRQFYVTVRSQNLYFFLGQVTYCKYNQDGAIEKKVEAKLKVSGEIITNKIAYTASQKRVMSYIVKEKQKDESKVKLHDRKQ